MTGFGPSPFGAVCLVPMPSMMEFVEDWSGVRSPARARRRRAKHPQRIVIREVPQSAAYVFGPEAGGPVVVAHPDIIARLVAEAERGGKPRP